MRRSKDKLLFIKIENVAITVDKLLYNAIKIEKVAITVDKLLYNAIKIENVATTVVKHHGHLGVIFHTTYVGKNTFMVFWRRVDNDVVCSITFLETSNST